MVHSKRARAAALIVAVAGACAGACQTPASITFAYRTDVDCAVEGPRTVGVVVGVAEAIGDVLEPTTTKECAGTPPAGEFLEVGSVVALPGAGTETVVGMKVILGVTRPSDECGAKADEDGNPWGGCIVARRRLAFLDGEALTVDVPLYRDCIGVPCDEDETCVPARGCVSAEVAPGDCVGSGCGIDDLGTGSSSSSSSATSTSTGEGGGTTTTATATSTTTTSTTSSGGGEGGAGGSGSTSSGGGEGGGTGGGAECTDAGGCTDLVDDDCIGVDCLGGSCAATLLDGAACMYTRTPGSGLCEDGVCCQGPGDCEVQPLGALCSSNSACQSGFCADGRCCDGACAGECESCRVVDTQLADGLCGDVFLGLDPHNECPGSCEACSAGACTTFPSCVGACGNDGDDCDACQVNGWVQGGSCAGGDCIGIDLRGFEAPPPAPTGPPMPCQGFFMCVAGQGCLTQCTNDTHCLPGYGCNALGECVQL